MRKIVHILLLFSLLVGGLDMHTGVALQADDLLDLADVPLPVQELPEDGYQVLTGDYLAPAEIVSLVAQPRNLDAGDVASQIDSIGLSHAYVLDLVLPEDRAWQNSPLLAVQQTSVYLLDDENNTDDLVNVLNDYSATTYVTDKDPAVEGATTVATIGESGDMLRTVVAEGRVVIEIVSMDATGLPDETGHILIVQGTLERLANLRDSGGTGLSSAALTLNDDDSVMPFAHTQQTGVHGVYRLRDGVVQPAVGELGTSGVDLPAGLNAMYLSNDAARTGGGNALVSIWLASFDTPESASDYFDTVVSGTAPLQLSDPYFQVDDEESWTGQGVVGLYRVTGTFDGARYSGTVEIRLAGDIIVVVGYRSVGAALPGADITSALVDYQLDCIDASRYCAPFDLASALPPVVTSPLATPIELTSSLSSAEFGWTLPWLGPEWIISEQFTSPGYDRISLQYGDSLFEFESVINHHGEPVQCVLDELHLLQVFEEHADIRLWEDASGNTVGGNTPSSAWVVYRVEPLAEERADQEYVIRIDCFTLMPGSANLVMSQTTPVDVWTDEFFKGDILRDGLILPVVEVTP